MSVWRIAYRFFRNDWRRYVAFLASTAFTVMIYFLYTALVRHPDLQSGYRYAHFAVQGMKAAAVVIAVFAFLFLLYSSSSFVRLRMKELGLLSLLGVSRRQLVQIILSENLIIAVVSLALGLGAGLLLLKLFFMGSSALLLLPKALPFRAGVDVWLHTILVFGGMFVAVSASSLRMVLSRSVVELVRAARKPKAAPSFSVWRLAVGLILLVTGYVWACVRNPNIVLLGVVPVTAIVSVGTVILMREASIACLAFLRSRSRFYFRPGPLLTVSQLVYKIQDNYRVLAAAAILVAVILSAVGTAFTLYAMTTSDVEGTIPVPIQLAQYGDIDNRFGVETVNTVLDEYDLNHMQYQEVVALKGRLEDRDTDLAIIPYSFYQDTRSNRSKTYPLSSDDRAILIYPRALFSRPTEGEEPVDRQVQVGGQTVTLLVQPDETGRLLNPSRYLSFVLVVSDDRYSEWMQGAEPEERISISLWTGAWRSKAMRQASSELLALFTDESAQITMTSVQYYEQIVTMGVVVFIGVFVSLVFVAACFSLLYSRLFTDIDEDRKYVRRLRQVGVTEKELHGQAIGQMTVIFLLPFVVGLAHSTFAMYALGTLTQRVVLQYGWAAALFFLFLFGAFFAGTRLLYWRSLREGLQREVGSGAF